MKRIIFSIFAAVIAVSASGFNIKAATGEIRIATQPVPLYSPIFVAKQKKWIDEELIKAGVRSIKWTSFAAGPPINESFAAGQQDIGFLGDTPAIIAKAAGIDIRAIGIASSGTKSLAIVVPAKSPLHSPKDLKGKKIGVVKGSYAHHLLVLVLQKGGLVPSDVQLVNLTHGDIATAITAGSIDAGAVWEPLITRLESNGTVRVLADGTGIKKGTLLIVASSSYIAGNRAAVKALLRAYDRGAKYIKSNPKEAAALISGDVNLTQDLLVKVFEKFDYASAIHSDDIAELKKSEAFMKKERLIKSSVNIDAFVETTLAK